MALFVERIDRYAVELPFREAVAPHMQKELPHWRYLEVLRVELSSGHVGVGECMPFYTWGRTTSEDIEEAMDQNAMSLLWDDSLGAGLEMALMDAVGRALEVPIYELLGGKIHDRVPVSWWCIDMPAAALLAEAQLARERGYTSLKFKGRPWYDIGEQVTTLGEGLPAGFDLTIDFNETLLDAERAIPILDDLAIHDVVASFEGPIPQEDVSGNSEITERYDESIALHYGRPPFATVLREQICDGFVAAGGVSKLSTVNAAAATGSYPFWLQLVGSDLTLAYLLHCGAAFEQATWSGVTCCEVFDAQVLTDPIPVEEGYASVPDRPGHGYDIDMDVIAEYEVDVRDKRHNPPRLIECTVPDGPTTYLAEQPEEVNFIIAAAMDEQLPFYPRGATARLVPEDGSETWWEMHERAREGPVVVDEPVC